MEPRTWTTSEILDSCSSLLFTPQIWSCTDKQARHWYSLLPSLSWVSISLVLNGRSSSLRKIIKKPWSDSNGWASMTRPIHLPGSQGVVFASDTHQTSLIGRYCYSWIFSIWSITSSATSRKSKTCNGVALLEYERSSPRHCTTRSDSRTSSNHISSLYFLESCSISSTRHKWTWSVGFSSF